MSPARQSLTVEQEPYLAVRSFACDYGSGTVIEPHCHSWHQLLYASAGAMSVHAGNESWMIPPGKAVFIPAGCLHWIRMWGRVEMRSLAFPEGRWEGGMGGDCRVISVSALLRELVLRVVEMAALDSRISEHQRLAGVLLDEMRRAPVEPLALPVPSDARALAAAQQVLADPGGGESLERLARRCGAGRRTLERLFRAETEMSFGLWRQKVRLLDSVRRLAEGRSVTDAALDAGYASVSAYIAAFKQTFGMTPGKLRGN